MEIGGTTTQNGPKMDPWNHRNPTEPYNWNRRTLPITEFQALALTPPPERPLGLARPKVPIVDQDLAA